MNVKCEIGQRWLLTYDDELYIAEVVEIYISHCIFKIKKKIAGNIFWKAGSELLEHNPPNNMYKILQNQDCVK